MLKEPKCFTRNCKHFNGVIQPEGTELGETVACAAFPEGIPKEIAYGTNLHLDPYKGDSGIQYEQAKEGGSV